MPTHNATTLIMIEGPNIVRRVPNFTHPCSITTDKYEYNQSKTALYYMINLLQVIIYTPYL
jgi:hypothetical protein